MTAATLIGSSWDTAASTTTAATADRYRAEWVDGSACHPALAEANVTPLQGRDVLEALAGDRLERLGGHAQQYATTAVVRLLRSLEPLAEAGGWWCSGLDPATDWRTPQSWGCLKPDRPRLAADKPGKVLKYEHPWGVATRLFWLAVPAAVAQLVADRHRLTLPLEVADDATGSAGAFWRWWAQTPDLPLVITEGAKKAGALLSAGVPAVALPGIWNGAPKNPANGRPALHPDLAAVPLEGRPVSVLFDRSDRRDPDEPKAARRLGRLLERAGAVVKAGCCPGPAKGADDHLAAGGSWEQLADALAPVTGGPVLPRLRSADRVAPAGQWLGDACPLPGPDEARLVALSASMGAGKTEAIAAALAPLMARGVRVVLVTHRRSLGAALADRLGLPWGDDAAPGSDLRQQGLALCVDSLCPGSGLAINPGDWRGCVVVIDEAAAVLAHALNGTTAVASRRPAVLQTLAALLAGAAQVIVADAQLSDPVLEALEAATGARALLIASEHRPATGRPLVVHPTRDSWRAELVAQLADRRRLWVATTAATPGASNSAQNLATLALQHWPEARVLLVDAATVADDDHDASRLAADPDGIAGAYDVVIASPAVAAGLSVTLRDHFAAVLVVAGGTTDPDAVAQAAARVRDDCPRHLFAPEQSPGGDLRTGSGDTDPRRLLQHLNSHEAAAVGQLVAAGDWSPERNDTGPWLPLWARFGAMLNGQRLGYRATVVALLEREGYSVSDAAPLDDDATAVAEAAAEALKSIRAKAQAADDAATIAAAPITAAEARELSRKRKRSPAERAQLARYRVAEAWGLGAAPPTAAILEADREGLSQRARLGWILRSIDARQLVARHDRAVATALAPDGRYWAPDLCRKTLGPTVTAADALGLPAWLERSDGGDWFTADDAALLELQALAIAHGSSLRQVLGVSPGKRATTTLRQLLALAGYMLEAKRSRDDGARAWRYRVVAEPRPDGADRGRLEAAWIQQLRGPAGAV